MPLPQAVELGPPLVRPKVRPVDDAEPSRVVFDLAVGETLDVGNDITVTVLSKSGRQARLLVRAPRSMALKMGAGRT